MERYVFIDGIWSCAFGRKPYSQGCCCFHCKKENVLAKEAWIKKLATYPVYPFVYNICCYTRNEWLECRCSTFCTLTPEEEAAYKACTCNYCQEDKIEYPKNKL